MLKKYIGDKDFYRSALAIALPIMLQNGITNLVNLIDNIMIGSIGTLEMSGVAITNQLIFIFNLCIFGAVSGAGIFCAQFFGKSDYEGVRQSTRFKIIACVLLALAGIGVFYFLGDKLIMLYLQGEGTVENASLTLSYGRQYLDILLITFIPVAFTQVYASTLRETGKPILPMNAGLIAVFVNLAFNYILIYGHLGAPKLGVVGAALATAISRFVELAIVVIIPHVRVKKYPFIKGLYKSFKISGTLAKNISVKGMPLLINEALFSIGYATLNMCYSLRSQDVVAATNISSTLWNVISVSFAALGTTVGIMAGHRLGARDIERAKDDVRKMITFTVIISSLIAMIYASLGFIFPRIYNATDSVKELASSFILVSAIFMPFQAIVNSSYFTLRAGGKTFITILFDCVFIWTLCVPVAFCLASFTKISITAVYASVLSLDILKALLGLTLIKKGVWINNIVD